MKNYLIFAILFLCCAAAGCNTKGEPVEHANACNPENDGKTVEVAGFLNDKGSLFCSNTGGGPVRCGFKLLANAGDDKGISADIETGSGANEVEKPEKGYKKEDIKVRDDNGNPITYADKVRVTGVIHTSKNAGGGNTVCYLTVAKIEK
jgi:hypothetical protein